MAEFERWFPPYVDDGGMAGGPFVGKPKKIVRRKTVSLTVIGKPIL